MGKGSGGCEVIARAGGDEIDESRVEWKAAWLYDRRVGSGTEVGA